MRNHIYLRMYSSIKQWSSTMQNHSYFFTSLNRYIQLTLQKSYTNLYSH